MVPSAQPKAHDFCTIKTVNQNFPIMDWLMGKSKKKEKEAIGSETKVPPFLDPSNCKTAFLSVTELRELISLPNGLDYREWIALHCYYIFENVNLVYDVVSEYCSPVNCPTMLGAGNTVYPWIDDKGKKTKLSAPLYVDNVMTNVQKLLLDENVFPTKYGNQFPTNFECYIRKALRLLLQVINHLYASHYAHNLRLGFQAHLNTTFAHLVIFGIHFELLEPLTSPEISDPSSPLAQLIAHFRLRLSGPPPSPPPPQPTLDCQQNSTELSTALC